MPTFNEADNVEPLVAALLDALPAGTRITIVDDASPDGTGEIADRLAACTTASTSCTARARRGSAPPTSPAFGTRSPAAPD